MGRCLNVTLTRWLRIRSYLHRSSPALITSPYPYPDRHYSSGPSGPVFVTTPIFYVNASPHIGHLYTSVIADAHYRYNLLKNGNGGDGIFSTGTDEHGMKIEKAAKAAGLGVKQHCDKVSSSFLEMTTAFDISATDFVRTTEARHKEAVQEFWKTLQKSSLIYKSEYSGWYSIPDEAFIPEASTSDKQLGDGSKIKICTESGHPVEWTSEQNYIFKLKQFIPEVRKWILDKEPIKPLKYGDILLRWIDEGFEDLSVSRPASRFSWGIPVPNDPSQIIYVWLDALVNYLTVSGYPNKMKKWPPDLQIVGKDIIKFHGIYWPAFLLAAGLEPPKEILCHGHWTVDDKKMSKSLGNVVDPFALSSIYGSDGLRYFLLREGTPHADANFTEDKLLNLLNAELADTLGNLLSRCSGKVVNPLQIWPIWDALQFPQILEESQHAKNLQESLTQLPGAVEVAYNSFNFYRGLELIMETIRKGNLYVEETKPWALARKSPEDPSLLAMISLVFETLRVASIMLNPIIPNLSTLMLGKKRIFFGTF